MEMKLFISLWLAMALKTKLNTTTTTENTNTYANSPLLESKQLVEINNLSKLSTGNPRNSFPTKFKEIFQKKTKNSKIILICFK